MYLREYDQDQRSSLTNELNELTLLTKIATEEDI